MPTPHADSVPFTTAPAIQAPHGFFGRNGGVSTGWYSTLNTGFSVGDDRALVIENCARASRALGFDPDKRLGLNQTHSAICHTVGAHQWKLGDAPDGDALVTDTPGVMLSVLTADCAPVLFDGGHVVGAAHAGWGGALGGVLEATIKAMQARGAETIAAAIGPCIGWDSYEVSAGFEKPFLAEDAAADTFFREGAPGKLHFNLAGYCAHRLTRAGLRVVGIVGHDTCAMEDAYFSHRRMTRRAEPARGLQMSAIGLKQA